MSDAESLGAQDRIPHGPTESDQPTTRDDIRQGTYPSGHSEPRAEWGEAEVEEAAIAAYRCDDPDELWTTDHADERYRALARAVLEASGAVPRVEHEQVRDASRALLRKAGMVPLEWEGFWDAARDLAAIVNGDSSLDAAKLKYRVRTQDAEDRAFEAESQLAALRARCEGAAKEIRDAIDSGSVDLNDLYALAGRLGGPDDAPKEPTRKPKMCPDCGEPLNEPGRPGHGGGPPVPPKIHGHLGYRHSCGSLPERDR